MSVILPSSQIQKTVSRTAARIAVLSLLVAFVFIAGLAFANLDGGKVIPSGQDSTIPIWSESQMPSLFETKPVNATLETQRIPTKPVHYVPARDVEQVVPTSVDPHLIASIAPKRMPSDTQVDQGAYAIPAIPSLVDAS